MYSAFPRDGVSRAEIHALIAREFPRFFEFVHTEEFNVFEFRLWEVQDKTLMNLVIKDKGRFCCSIHDYRLTLFNGWTVTIERKESYDFEDQLKEVRISPDGKYFIVHFHSQPQVEWWRKNETKTLHLFKLEKGNLLRVHSFEPIYDEITLHFGFIDNETYYETQSSTGIMGRIGDLGKPECPNEICGGRRTYFDRDFFFPLLNGYFIMEGENHLSLCKMDSKKQWEKNFDNFEVARLPMCSDLTSKWISVGDAEYLTRPSALGFQMAGEGLCEFLMGSFRTDRENEYRLLVWRLSDLLDSKDKVIPPLRTVEYAEQSLLLGNGKILGVDVPFKGSALVAYASCNVKEIHSHMIQNTPVQRTAVEIVTGFL